MNIAASTGYQAPTAPLARVDSARELSDTKDTKDAKDTNATTSAQFAVLMELLAKTNPKLQGLMKQTPANGVGLLDQLLAGANVGSDTNTALDAARYGMLTDSGLTAKTTAGNQSKISAAVLSRIAARKTPSVEELLAVGDKAGALARAKLDAILATAGTNEGAKLAATSALAAQLLQSASNPTTPVTNTDGLDPDFKARLDRVISRMKSEAGLDVTVVETVRSQDRQDTLFAQGRTTPGDVVTWTQDSAHTRGQAADVMVGGSFNNPAGFALLQKIAREEGLKTLGAIDPGHLEMSKESQAIDAATRALASADAKITSATSSGNGIARVAGVAQVAAVGNVAAQTTDATRASTAVIPPATGARSTSTSGTKPSLSDGAQEKSANTERNLKGTSSDDGNSASFGNMSRSNGAQFIGPKESGEPQAPAVDGAQRVQDIDTLRDSSSSKPLSQITLEIDGANGETQQITVDVRGNAVGTHISTDEVSAQRLRSHVGELQGALENRGLEADVVRITGNVRPADAAEGVKQISAVERDAMRLSGAANSNAGDGATQQHQRERSTAARDWDDRQAARDEQRRNGKQPDRSRQQYQEKQ